MLMLKPRLGQILHCGSYLLCPWVRGSGTEALVEIFHRP